MVKVKTPLSSLEACIIDGIKDVQANNIKFHNIAFDCRTIEDYEGRVFVRKRTGKWIEIEDFYNRISGRCSVCGWESHMYDDDVVGMNFCPNCGADMRGEEECTKKI